jgi:hypothetical protein
LIRPRLPRNPVSAPVLESALFRSSLERYTKRGPSGKRVPMPAVSHNEGKYRPAPAHEKALAL